MQRDDEVRVSAWAGELRMLRVLRVLRLMAMAAAAAMVLLFAVTAVKRVGYGFELEWVEDGNLLEMMRVLRHQPVYVAPTVQYVPYLYTPLFFYVSAAMAKLVGARFAAMRMVSVLSTVGIFATVYGLVTGEFPGRQRRRARRLAAAMAVGFFACAYPETGGFFDLGRVDMLCLLLAMLALLAGRKGFAVLAGLLWVASVETKQSMLPVAVLLLCFEWELPRRLLLGLGTFAVGLGVSVMALNHATGGWFGRYGLGTARGFPVVARQGVMFWPQAVLHPFAVVCLLGLGGAVLAPPDWRGRAARFYAMSGVGMVLGAWFVEAHKGASANALLPAYLWLAIVGGIGLGRLYERGLLAEDALWGRAATGVLMVAALAQVAMHAYTPSLFEPNEEERAALVEVVAAARRLPGDVLVMEHPYYAVIAGHREFANGEAAQAVMMRGDAEAETLRMDYAALLASGTLSGVMLDAGPERLAANKLWLPAEFAREFPVRVQLGKVADVKFLTPHPTMLYMPCPQAGGAKARALFPGYFVDDAGCGAHE